MLGRQWIRHLRQISDGTFVSPALGPALPLPVRIFHE
jgi:hypothetical protein